MTFYMFCCCLTCFLSLPFMIIFIVNFLRRQKKKNLSSFTPPHVVPYLSDFLLWNRNIKDILINVSFGLVTAFLNFFFWVSQKNECRKFGMTWGWNDRIFLFGWPIPFYYWYIRMAQQFLAMDFILAKKISLQNVFRFL